MSGWSGRLIGKTCVFSWRDMKWFKDETRHWCRTEGLISDGAAQAQKVHFPSHCSVWFSGLWLKNTVYPITMCEVCIVCSERAVVMMDGFPPISLFIYLWEQDTYRFWNASTQNPSLRCTLLVLGVPALQFQLFSAGCKASLGCLLFKQSLGLWSCSIAAPQRAVHLVSQSLVKLHSVRRILNWKICV